MYPLLLAAPLNHRGDSRVGLYVYGVCITIAIGAEGGQEPGSQVLSGSWEAIEDEAVRMSLGDRGRVSTFNI